MIIHKRFDNLTRKYDIALLSMSDPSIEFQVNICNNQYNNAVLTFSAPHNSICLRNSEDNLVDRKALVTGWGKVKKTRKLMSPQLRQVEVSIISNMRCMDLFK